MNTLRRAALGLVLTLALTANAVAVSLSPIASIQQPWTDPNTGATEWATVCSAFSIDQERGLYMTAAHCLANELTLDWHIAWPVYVNEEHDLAVLETRGVSKPALELCAAKPDVGVAITAIGFAYGLDFAMERKGFVAGYGPVPISATESIDFMVMDFAIIGGMSGGPVLDTEAGCVVSLNQMGNQYVGLGRSLDVLKEHTSQFWTRR